MNDYTQIKDYLESNLDSSECENRHFYHFTYPTPDKEAQNMHF